MHYLDALDNNSMSLEAHRAQIREERERARVEFPRALRDRLFTCTTCSLREFGHQHRFDALCIWSTHRDPIEATS